MEKLDHFVEDNFDGNGSDLPVPIEVIEQAKKIIDEVKESSTDLTTLIIEKNETDEKIKFASSEFVIWELQDTHLEMNKTISMIRNKRLDFHFDLDFMVRRMCTDHQAEKSQYNELGKATLTRQNAHSRQSGRQEKMLDNLYRRKIL